MGIGPFEEVILQAVRSLDNQEAYGMSIHQNAEEMRGRRVNIAAVYSTLDRLQAKGYLVSEIIGPTDKPGGRSKKIYHILESGQKALIESEANRSKMAEAIAALKRIGENYAQNI